MATATAAHMGGTATTAASAASATGIGAAYAAAVYGLVAKLVFAIYHFHFYIVPQLVLIGFVLELIAALDGPR